jgi:hypothetical protein
LSLEAYTIDVQKFFFFTVPHAAWEQSKNGRNPKFVQFVEQAMEHASQK